MKNNWSRNLLFVIVGIFWFSQYAYIPFFNPYLKELGTAASFVGLIVGSYGIIQLFLKIPIGLIVDKFKLQKTAVSMCCLFSSISCFGFFFFRTPFLYLLFRAIAGLAACGWVSFTVLYASYFEPENSTKAVVRLASSNYMGKFMAFLVGGFAAQKFGVESVFLICGVTAFIGFILTLTLEDRKIDSLPILIKDLAEVIKNRNLIVVSLLTLLCQFMSYATISSFTSDVAKGLGATSYQLGMMNIILTLPIILITFMGAGYLLTKFGVRALITAGFLLMALYCILVPLAENVTTLYFLQVIGGSGQGMVLSLMMGLSIKEIALEKRNTTMGFFQAVYGIGMSTGPIVMGYLVDVNAGSFLGPFIVISLVCVSGAFAAIFLLKERTASSK